MFSTAFVHQNASLCGNGLKAKALQHININIAKMTKPVYIWFIFQDTIIALQALSEFAAVVYNPFFNLSINILCEPAGFGYTFTIDKTNALLYQIVYVRKIYSLDILLVYNIGLFSAYTKYLYHVNLVL